MRREISKAVGELRRTIGHVLERYRPELHYMRGPGPKWRAKRSGTATATNALVRPR